MLDHVLYRSDAARPEAWGDPAEILWVSRIRNPAVGLTGFLHREDDRYFQFLEGPRTALEGTLARIGRDRRHRSMVVLRRGRHAARLFGGWSMGEVEPRMGSLREHAARAGIRLDLDELRAPEVLSFLRAAARRPAAR